MIALFCNLIVTTHDQVLNWLDSWLTTQQTVEYIHPARKEIVDAIQFDKFGILYNDYPSPKFNLYLLKKIRGTFHFYEFIAEPCVFNGQNILNFRLTEERILKIEELFYHTNFFHRRSFFVKYDLDFDFCLEKAIALITSMPGYEEFRNLPGVDSRIISDEFGRILELKMRCRLYFKDPLVNPLIKFYDFKFEFSPLSFLPDDNILICNLPINYRLSVVKEFNYLDAQFPIIKAYLGKYSTVAAAGVILAAAITPIAFGCYFFLM